MKERVMRCRMAPINATQLHEGSMALLERLTTALPDEFCGASAMLAAAYLLICVTKAAVSTGATGSKPVLDVAQSALQAGNDSFDLVVDSMFVPVSAVKA